MLYVGKGNLDYIQRQVEQNKPDVEGLQRIKRGKSR